MSNFEDYPFPCVECGAGIGEPCQLGCPTIDLEDDWSDDSLSDWKWEQGYLPGSGENMYDESYIKYLNRI